MSIQNYMVEINGGPTQTIESLDTIYEAAAFSALLTLPHKPDENFDIVKIWVAKLLPDHGPYFYTFRRDIYESPVEINNRKW